MSTGNASGSDCILNVMLSIVIKKKPTELLKVFNKYLREKIFRTGGKGLN